MLGPTGGHTGWLSLHPRGPPHRPAPQATCSQGHLLLKAPSGQRTLSPADTLPTSALPPAASGAVRAAPVSCKPWATPRPPKGNCAQVQSRCSCRVSLQAEQTQGDIVSTWLTPQALRPPGLQAPPSPPGEPSRRDGGRTDQLLTLPPAQSRTGHPGPSYVGPGLCRTPKSQGDPLNLGGRVLFLRGSWPGLATSVGSKAWCEQGRMAVPNIPPSRQLSPDPHPPISRSPPPPRSGPQPAAGHLKSLKCVPINSKGFCIRVWPFGGGASWPCHFRKGLQSG